MRCVVCYGGKISPNVPPFGGYICENEHIQCSECNTKNNEKCSVCAGCTMFMRLQLCPPAKTVKSTPDPKSSKGTPLGTFINLDDEIFGNSTFYQNSYYQAQKIDDGILEEEATTSLKSVKSVRSVKSVKSVKNPVTNSYYEEYLRNYKNKRNPSKVPIQSSECNVKSNEKLKECLSCTMIARMRLCSPTRKPTSSPDPKPSKRTPTIVDLKDEIFGDSMFYQNSYYQDQKLDDAKLEEENTASVKSVKSLAASSSYNEFLLDNEPNWDNWRAYETVDKYINERHAHSKNGRTWRPPQEKFTDTKCAADLLRNLEI